MKKIFLTALIITGALYADAQNKFEKEIAAFEAKNKVSPVNTKDLIVFTGSSSVRKWKTLAQDMPGKNVINRGFGGSTTPDLIEMSDRVITVYHPKQVFIYEGDNDLKSGRTADQVFEDFKTVFAKIRDKNKNTRISFISIKPSPSRRNLIPEQLKANKMIAGFLKGQKNVDYIDVYNPMLASDGQMIPKYYVADSLHMTADGYKVWTKVIQPYVK